MAKVLRYCPECNKLRLATIQRRPDGITVKCGTCGKVLVERGMVQMGCLKKEATHG